MVWSALRWLAGLGLIGIGLILVGVLGFVGMAAISDARFQCPDGNDCNDAKTVALVGLGGVAIGLGMILGGARILTGAKADRATDGRALRWGVALLLIATGPILAGVYASVGWDALHPPLDTCGGGSCGDGRTVVMIGLGGAVFGLGMAIGGVRMLIRR